MSNLPNFDDASLADRLYELTDEQLDELPYGVIGFNYAGVVVRYNRTESQAATFAPGDVIGQHVFIELAPCLNNYLVAGRFEDCVAAGETLDETMPYVLTFRMRPTPIRLRILCPQGEGTRYLLVQRAGTAP